MTYTIKHRGYLALVSSVNGLLQGVVNLADRNISFCCANFKELLANMESAIAGEINL